MNSYEQFGKVMNNWGKKRGKIGEEEAKNTSYFLCNPLII